MTGWRENEQSQRFYLLLHLASNGKPTVTGHFSQPQQRTRADGAAAFCPQPGSAADAMMEDRDYMQAKPSRQPVTGSTQRWPSVLHLVLAANLAIGVLQLGMGWQVAIDSSGAALPLGGVSLQSLAAGEVWGLITSLFVHTGAAHLLVNVLFIAYFGRTMLSLLGPGGFLKLYFGSGLVGAALQMLVQALALADSSTPVMGASACACGLTRADKSTWARPATSPPQVPSTEQMRACAYCT